MATLGTLEYLISIKDDGLEAELSRSEKKVKGWGNKLSSWTVAKGQMIGHFAEAAIKSTARVVKSTVTETVKAFGKYEQLSEGAKLLFGDAFDYIEQRSKEAYSTVQISQAEYLEQANAYATGLKTALNGDANAAAELADRIITAQADVVAATGANREGVENAFKGLMRGNFMMLDNLQLGIKGSKEGMKEVIDSVNAWNKANGKATKYQIGNLADMNNALIDYIKMQGLAGYAYNEAADTLEGSFASAKAAWKDLLQNIGRGKDIKESVRRFGDAAKKAFKNLRPVIRESVTGIFTAVKELLPEIGGLFEDLKQDLKESDIPIFRVLGSGLEKLQLAWTGLNALIEDFPGTVEALKQSDDPFAKLIGGGLSFIYDTLNWIVEKSGSVEQAITNIALAFAGIKVSSTVLSFISKLLQLGANAKIMSLFGGGAGAGAGAGSAGAGAASAGAGAAGAAATKGGLRTWFGTGMKALGNVAPFIAPLALGIDGFLHDQQLVKEAYKKGQEFEQAYSDGVQQFRGDELYNLWDMLTKYNTVGNSEDKAKMNDFVRDYMAWFNDEAVNPALDRMTNAMTDEQFDRFHEVMERMNAGEMFYSNEDIDSVRQAMSDAISVLESEMKSNPVKPNVDTNAMQSQLNSAGFTAPVTPQMVFGGSDFFGNLFKPKAKGDMNVPYDNYPALLHRGEIVLNQSQARRYRDGEVGGDLNVPAIIAQSVEASMKRVNVLLNGDKVADITTERTKRNINARSYSRVRAYGG